jgi:flagellar capping protein FliD
MAGFSIDGLMSNLDTMSIVNAIIESESGMINHLRERLAAATNVATTYKPISTVMLALKTNVVALTNCSRFDLTSMTDSINGSISRRTEELEEEVDYYSKMIEDYEARLEIRSQKLYQQYYDLEMTMNELQSTSTYFSTQLE